ncbi:MAG: hypothetical protein VKP72_05470 [bacterium]|nr:hypothetical protein [bacterium]
MRRQRLATLSIALVLTTLSWNPSPAKSEEFIQETDKVYLEGMGKDSNGNEVRGMWVEFERRRYTRNENYILNPIGRYDATIQQFLESKGLNRALSQAEMSAIYNRYGIPLATNANYSGGAYHDFSFDNAMAALQRDVQNGSYQLPANVPIASIQNLNTVLGARDSAALLDALPASTINSYIDAAFAAQGGGRYVYVNGDGHHPLSYSHGVNFINPAQFDQNTYNSYRSWSAQAVLLNDKAAYKRLLGMGNLDSFVQAGRFTQLAALIDQGLAPSGMAIDTWVNTVNGPVHVVEPQPTAARLREIARWLLAGTWATHSPIALDLNHDGKIGVTGASSAQNRLRQYPFAQQGSVWFDIMAVGRKQHIEWLNGDGDGLLVLDRQGKVTQAAHGNGEVDATVLFGDARGYANGYHKLAYAAATGQVATNVALDDTTSWSTLFRAQRTLKGTMLGQLKVWIDANRDARIQQTELRTLDQLGISEVDTKPTIRRNPAGEYLIQSTFVQHGKRYMTEDVWFAEDPATAAARN